MYRKHYIEWPAPLIVRDCFNVQWLLGRGTSELVPYQKRGTLHANFGALFKSKIYYLIGSWKVNIGYEMKVYIIYNIMCMFIWC